jgi:hypothetical protein
VTAKRADSLLFVPCRHVTPRQGWAARTASASRGSWFGTALRARPVGSTSRTSGS